MSAGGETLCTDPDKKRPMQHSSEVPNKVRQARPEDVQINVKTQASVSTIH